MTSTSPCDTGTETVPKAEPKPEPKLSWGHQVARLILAAKIEHSKRNLVLSIREVGEIIDMAYLAKHPEAPETVIASNPGAFGDRKVIPPSPEWVTAYSLAIGYPLHGQQWCDSYAQKGWLVGKAKMKDWQAAVRNWKTNDWASRQMKVQPSDKPNYSTF